ncbi:uncharacterized protein LOC143447290 [Clavelina lepadiformis]|uniref:uncharacterized protein LOC143447290 n=1 Tax=Clavelina lepadiformis TaxID=159417 RepID=UPI004041D80B
MNTYAISRKSSSKGKLYFFGWLHIKSSKSSKTSLYNKNQFEHRYYTQLRGNNLVLFTKESDAVGVSSHVEDKIPLKHVTSVTNTLKTRTLPIPSTTSPRAQIVLAYGPGNPWTEVKLWADSSYEQEEWYRYIHTTALLQIPKNIDNILPGQIQELEDIIQEISRPQSLPNLLHPDLAEDMYVAMNVASTTKASASRRISMIDGQPPQRPLRDDQSSDIYMDMTRQSHSPHRSVIRKGQASPRRPPSFRDADKPLPSLPVNSTNIQVPKKIESSAPRWMYNQVMSRSESERLLDQNLRLGNLLVRRRTISDLNNNWPYAVSMKLENGKFKHFLVKKVSEGVQEEYMIHLGGDVHPHLYSLEDVVNYFVEESEGVYKPLTEHSNRPADETEDFYNTKISLQYASQDTRSSGTFNGNYTTTQSRFSSSPALMSSQVNRDATISKNVEM